MRVLSIVLLSLLFVSNLLAADSRAPFIYKLIYESSVAKHIESSGTLEAKMKHKAAKNLYDNAIAAATRGENNEEERLLTAAVKEMEQAVKMSKLPEDVLKKQEGDYLNKRDTVDSFVTALVRIADEKGRTAESKVVLSSVSEKRSYGELLAGRKSFLEALKYIDEAYLLLRQNITALRNGDTLVRDLNFKNAKEAYEYHRNMCTSMSLLIEVFLSERVISDSDRKLLDALLKRASGFLLEADRLASNNQHEEGLNLVESAKNELRKAAGIAGIYIPR